ncbi:hypothetical protein J4475_04545 [Candidatus Woesearchaeota archaeon]|nr:hypothetical protein [Candidatus Woesearchaeota archaeon]
MTKLLDLVREGKPLPKLKAKKAEESPKENKKEDAGKKEANAEQPAEKQDADRKTAQT